MKFASLMEVYRRQIHNWRRYLWIAIFALLTGAAVSLGAHRIYATPNQQILSSPTATATATATATPAFRRYRTIIPGSTRSRIQSPFLGSGGDPAENTEVLRLQAENQPESPLSTAVLGAADAITATDLVTATGIISGTGALSHTVALSNTIVLTDALSGLDTLTSSFTSTLSATNTVSVTGPVSAFATISDSGDMAIREASTLSDTTSVSTTAAISEMLHQPIADVADGGDEAATLDETMPEAVSPELTDPLALLVPTPTPAPTSTSTSTPTQTPPEPQPLPLPTPDGVERTVRVPILMYHYLSAPPPDANIYRQDLSVSPELFAAHLDAIAENGYHAITLYDLVDYFAQGKPLPPNPIIITFDDGYADNYSNALPILREHGMSATFFVVTDFMDEQRPEYLNWDMAREMLDTGMKIESHGRNHVSLQAKDNDYLVWQALGSLETIEYELGVRPRFVSYPAGEYDQNTIELFKSAGYWAGVTTIQGASHSSESPFELHRIRVRGTTTPEELLHLLELDW